MLQSITLFNHDHINMHDIKQIDLRIKLVLSVFPLVTYYLDQPKMLHFVIALWLFCDSISAIYIPTQHCMTTTNPFNELDWNITSNYGVTNMFKITPNGLVTASKEGVQLTSYNGELQWNVTISS
jgi:hypothetical protein